MVEILRGKKFVTYLGDTAERGHPPFLCVVFGFRGRGSICNQKGEDLLDEAVETKKSDSRKLAGEFKGLAAESAEANETNETGGCV